MSKAGGWQEEEPDGAGAESQAGGRRLPYGLCEGWRKDEKLRAVFDMY